MTSSSIKSIFYSTRSTTDLIFTAIPKIEAPLGRDNRGAAPSFLAPTYESGLINSPTLGSFHSPPSVVLFLSLLLCCSSSAAAAAATELRVLVVLGRCITLNRPENRGEPLHP